MQYAIDPEFADLVGLLPSPSTDVAAMRQMLDDMLPVFNADIDTNGLAIEDRLVPGPPDGPEVRVRTYVPEAGATGAGLICLHGGGFTVGSLDSEHARVTSIAREVGAVVVSVDYRLAPEHPFPAAIDDAYAALAWFHTNAPVLGVEVDRIGVVGGSAGGGLAAALALVARDRGGPSLCFQFLGIPMLDDRMVTTSMSSFADTPMFSRPAALACWEHYLGEAPGEVSPYAAPARASDLRGLPPAYISTMEFDPLRDEGILYGMALLAAGVSCELHSYPGTFHGSSMLATAQVTQRETDETISVLRLRLA